MVSGFFTSPKDQERIISGDDRDNRTASMAMGSSGRANRLFKSSKAISRIFSIKGWSSGLVLVLLQEFHIERQALELPHQDVERFRQPRFQIVFTFEDLFVHAGPASHVV